jgi:uncharacterized protein (UPF0210 family)
VGDSCSDGDFTLYAQALDKAADTLGINFIGGFSALVHKGFTKGDIALINSLPSALSITNKVCGSVNVATTKAGINMDAVKLMGETISKISYLTRDDSSIGCAKLVVFANAAEDNPFMAGAFHGIGEPESVINVGVSGPGVVRSAVAKAGNCDLSEIADVNKNGTVSGTRGFEAA